MIELTISVILQGVILAVFLIIICVLIGWFEDITGCSFREIFTSLRTFDARRFYKACFRMILGLSALVGGRQNLGFLIAVTSATSYAGSTYMAFHDDLDYLQGLVAGWYLSIIAVAVAYDWRNPPHILVSKVVFTVGVLCLLFGMVALNYEYYHCLFVMGLTGAFTIVIGALLYMTNHSKVPDELREFGGQIDEDE